MKKITIEIETVNAAFGDYNGTAELSRLMHEIACSVEIGCLIESHKVRDINGNVCGKVTIE